MSGPGGEFGSDIRKQQEQTGAPSQDVADANATGMTEREKMEAGLPYLALDDRDLVKQRLRARRLCQKYNTHPWPEVTDDIDDPAFWGPDERRQILAEIFKVPLETIKDGPVCLEPPFYCDYGDNIKFQGAFYANFGFTVLDCAKVTLGKRIICGPSVQIYAATHSVELDERMAGYERAYPVEIGDDCWIGGGAIINGPCKIGKGVTVAAGAVVRGDVPDYVVVGGVPARILRRLQPPSGKYTPQD